MLCVQVRLRVRVKEGEHDGQCRHHRPAQEDGLQGRRHRHRRIFVQVTIVFLKITIEMFKCFFHILYLKVPPALQERDAEQNLPDDGHQLQVRPPPLRGRLWPRGRSCSRRPQERR